VSIRVSPLTIELAGTDMLITSPPKRLPATSNEVRVRVELSKKQLMIVRPRSRLRNRPDAHQALLIAGYGEDRTRPVSRI
jgi:hypothetical protein